MQNEIARRDFVMKVASTTLAAIHLSPAASASGFGASGFAQSTEPKARANAGAMYMYVGSFTGQGRGHGEGISVFGRKSASDSWSLVQVFSDFADPSFLCIDRQGRCLYSAHGAGTQVTAFRIDPSTGRV